jgi:hypothetical protein
VLLLATVWLVATQSTPDPTAGFFPGIFAPAKLSDFGFILYRNGLVLALHAMACVAGFIAGSSLPAAATGYSGRWRKVHDRAGPLAIAFVLAATLFSLGTQAYALGRAAGDLSFQLGISPLVLLLGLLPHALPELTALFLPLAPQGMGRAARGDHRHRRRSRPGARRGGRDRDVGDAGPPRYTF